MAATDETKLNISFTDYCYGAPKVSPYYNVLQLLFKTLKASADSASTSSSWRHRDNIAANLGNVVVAVNSENPREVLGFCVASAEWCAHANTTYIVVYFIESFRPREKVATQLLDYLFERQSKRMTLIPTSKKAKTSRRLLLISNPREEALSFWNYYMARKEGSVGLLKWFVGSGFGHSSGPLLDIQLPLNGVTFLKLIVDLKRTMDLKAVRPFTFSSCEGGGIIFTRASWDYSVTLFFTEDVWPCSAETWKKNWHQMQDLVVLRAREVKTKILCPVNRRLDTSYLPVLCSVFQRFLIAMHFIF